MNYLMKILEEKIINKGFDKIETGIAHNGKYILYQSYDIFPSCTTGILVDRKEVRFVIYNNYYALTDDNLIFRDLIHMSTVKEWYDNLQPLDELLEWVFNEIQEEIGLLRGGTDE